MSKQEFLAQLRRGLSGLPQDDIEERLEFYSEMIDDRMEEGISEEDAVRDIGDVDGIVAQIVADTPLIKIVKDKMKTKRKISAWEIVLLAVGSPIWLSLLFAAFAVILSVYLALWSVIISFWAVFVSVAGCAFGGIAGGGVMALYGRAFEGIALIGAGIFCSGVAIFLFFGCKWATKGILWLTKKIAIGIKNCFLRKES